jgi:hypothetical protein
VEHGGPNGPLTGGRAATRRLSDGERWRWPKPRSGVLLRCQRGGKEGGVECGEVRRDQGTLL